MNMTLKGDQNGGNEPVLVLLTHVTSQTPESFEHFEPCNKNTQRMTIN